MGTFMILYISMSPTCSIHQICLNSHIGSRGLGTSHLFCFYFYFKFCLPYCVHAFLLHFMCLFATFINFTFYFYTVRYLAFTFVLHTDFYTVAARIFYFYVFLCTPFASIYIFIIHFYVTIFILFSAIYMEDNFYLLFMNIFFTLYTHFYLPLQELFAFALPRFAGTACQCRFAFSPPSKFRSPLLPAYTHWLTMVPVLHTTPSITCRVLLRSRLVPHAPACMPLPVFYVHFLDFCTTAYYCTVLLLLLCVFLYYPSRSSPHYFLPDFSSAHTPACHLLRSFLSY